jgi:hypothetical protein
MKRGEERGFIKMSAGISRVGIQWVVKVPSAIVLVVIRKKRKLGNVTVLKPIQVGATGC